MMCVCRRRLSVSKDCWTEALWTWWRMTNVQLLTAKPADLTVALTHPCDTVLSVQWWNLWRWKQYQILFEQCGRFCHHVVLVFICLLLLTVPFISHLNVSLSLVSRVQKKTFFKAQPTGFFAVLLSFGLCWFFRFFFWTISWEAC